MHGVAQSCCRYKVSLQGCNGMGSGNLDGDAEERDTALATRVKLKFGLMIGFLSHSHMVTTIALHFRKVTMNTLLRQWQNHGNCKLWTTFNLPETGLRTALSDQLTRTLSSSASCLPSHRLLHVPSRDFLKNASSTSVIGQAKAEGLPSLDDQSFPGDIRSM